jgi:ELP3 family radical SAM enzyme/protein acetyltransferase
VFLKMTANIEDRYFPDLENVVQRPSPQPKKSIPFNFSDFVPIHITKLSAKQIENAEKTILNMFETKDYNISHYRSEFGMFKMIDLHITYLRMLKSQKYIDLIKRDDDLCASLLSFKNRSNFGVFVFTIVASANPDGQQFTCKHDCFMCPNIPGYARSYYPGEPAVERGYANNWEVGGQIWDRMRAYISTGNISCFEKTIIKGDFIVEGGTWSEYPTSYRHRFMQELYYYCNTIYDDNNNPRDMLSLKEEQEINKTVVGIRVVGLSVEVRPDSITDEFCVECREFGVTKVQIGVQHTFNRILKKINRGCYDRHTRIALQKLTEYGFKNQIHIMPDLPGSSPEIDKEMIEDIFSNFYEYPVDMLKIYPHVALEGTKTINMIRKGEFVPYGNDIDKIINVLIHLVKTMKKYDRYEYRIERVFRDFNHKTIVKGMSCEISNIADLLDIACKKSGINCVCIKCREIRWDKEKRRDADDYKIVCRTQDISCGKSVFISVETKDGKHVYGFLRLFLPDKYVITKFDVCKNSAMIREVHVYRQSVGVGQKGETQHVGFGTMLVREAKRIALEHKYDSIVVISGIGVMEYYKNKHGFVECEGNYLICAL